MNPSGKRRVALCLAFLGLALLASGCRRLRAQKAAPAEADPTPVPVSTEEARVPPAAAPIDPGSAPPSFVSTGRAGAVASASPPVVVPPGASHLEVVTSGRTVDVVGKAFAQRDKTSKEIVNIIVFRPSTSPAPTCENLSFIGGAMKTGGLATIGFARFGGSPGRFDVVGFGYADTTKDGFSVGGGGGLFDAKPTGTTIEIRSITGKKLEATVTAQDAGATQRASGIIVAKICPPL